MISKKFVKRRKYTVFIRMHKNIRNYNTFLKIIEYTWHLIFNRYGYVSFSVYTHKTQRKE